VTARRTWLWTAITVAAVVSLTADRTEADQGQVGCAISATPLAFGAYRVFDTQASESTADVSVRCSHAVTVRVTVSQGSFGQLSRRVMRSTQRQDELEYQVFLDQARNGVWGNGTGGSLINQVRLLPNVWTTLTMYGRIFASQWVGPGDYADGLVVTLAF
jgi:spore coat protein U-like protein